MNSDTITLRSSIKSSLMKKTLFRGTSIGILGLLPMFYASLSLNTSTLSIWGLPLYFGGLGMIALGMLPFRRLRSLENQPNKIELNENNEMIYFIKNKKTFTIPNDAIETLSYYEKNHTYGIAITLKNTPQNKVIIHNSSFDFSRYSKFCKKQYECDLFFPYFTKRGYETVNEFFQPFRLT